MSYDQTWIYPSAGTGNGYGPPGFPDPFCDAASLVMPTTLNEGHRLIEQVLLSSQGTYRTALRRVASYFVTSLVFGDDGTDSKEKDKYAKYAEDNDWLLELTLCGGDFLAYGESMISVVQKMQRRINCPGKRCGMTVPFSEFMTKDAYRFRWEGFKIKGHCPRCGYVGDFGTPKDMPMGDQTPLTIHRWNPKDIEVYYHPLTHRKEYFWKIPEEIAGPVRSGIPFHLEETPWEVVEAVRDGKYIQLDPDNILHVCEDTLAGVRMNGRGLSSVLANFRQAWYVQVLHRQNEAIAMDYVTPCRVVSPMPRAGADPASSDPVFSSDLNSFRTAMTDMIEERRKDPAKWLISPFPVQYSMFGGDANALAPKELIELGQKQLLDAAGIFQDLYTGSLQTQAAPLALRLHEAYWRPLTAALNKMAQFIAKRTAVLYHWQEVRARLEAPTSSDDIQRSAVKLQLAQGGAVAMGTAIKPLGLDYASEQKKIIDEQLLTAELQAKASEDAERSQQMSALVQPPSSMMGQQPPGGDPNAAAAGGAPQQQGAPPQGGATAAQPGMVQNLAMSMSSPPNVPKTPQSQMDEAQGLADQLMTLQPSQRRSELVKLKQQDSMMHKLVTSFMEDTRSQARSQGGQQLLQQQYGTT